MYLTAVEWSTLIRCQIECHAQEDGLHHRGPDESFDILLSDERSSAPFGLQLPFR